MDPVVKQKIADKLRGFLNREPLDHEIINGQNDANLMQWIAQDDAAAKTVTITGIQTDLDKVKSDTATTKSDVATLKTDTGNLKKKAGLP